jgi:geranylgeranyl diphosphate synthase, type II
VDDALRIERFLAQALLAADGPGAAPGLSAAVRHAVFPGGARVRPRLCLAVARACAVDQSPGALAAAGAIEMLHCASLVQDDLPCFDDAAMRRGQPAVHRVYGERLAILAGDALIVLAFQTMTRERGCQAERRLALLSTLATAVGMPRGIVAGQAWECESEVALSEYQRAKTGALFAAATVAGALAAGADPAPWQTVGESIGEAYQVVDDFRDVMGSAQELGKPTGRDAALGRPNAVSRLGLSAARARLQQLLAESLAAIPDCPGADQFHASVRAVMQPLLAPLIARTAA